ncbi:uncharacterized protein K02A2.6-like [Toxorhynchites rutilus septentrionalis]|uniref:uncharacterized protein K02A2.6-like n=1 Tax=Toxorhynchites rutilus septentrionalis TaxID=329112 RepID=UPI00247963C7|nr:uncharacterized protein K02A2.6-like [Toxorhynchites rutilus septentrionalis]
MTESGVQPGGNVAAAVVMPPTFALEPFDRNKSKWSRWVKRLQGAMEIFGVPQTSKKNLLLHYMGSETYNILCDHLSPVEPETKTFEEIVTTLGDFFDPVPLEMVELWKFRSRMQKEGETISEFITALQREAKYCKFDDYLPNALRNQLVFGLRNQRIRTRIIEERDLTFDKAKQISLSMEASGEGAEVLNRRMHEVNLMDRKKSKRQPAPISGVFDIVENEINRMVEKGILLKVNHSEWATPIVPVMKSANKVRLCGDFKLTVNKNLLVDEHPLPTIDELFANMAGGEKFSKLDLAQAYLQMVVRQEDQPILTLNTHLGLFQPTRLMYAVASAPAIFQREISQILHGIPGVLVFLDDVKITGPDDRSHLDRLREVLKRFHENNMRVNISKCEFFSDSIEYCGYVIDRHGIHKMKSKVAAIQRMPRPTNRDQVRAFLGLVNYYGRFLRDLSTKIYPINNLLKNKTPFVWSSHCERAFKWVKEQMQSDNVLVHYDTTLPLILAVDASPYGVGAVLSHIYLDGSEHPIQYASQTLNSTQQNYTQVDKEAYAIIYGVKKFYQYLFGRKFVLVTDNKPVSQIFSPNKELPTLSALRMQHYAVYLESFNFEIHYRPSKEHANADGMSRLPLPDTTTEDRIDEIDFVEVNQIQMLPVSVEELREHTKRDTAVQKLIQALKSGRSIDGCDRFGIDQNEFSLQSGCLMRGIRVYIPSQLRARVLEELHSGHFGVSRMKSLARSYCWWETIDRNIADLARDCSNCARTRNDPVRVPIHCWERPVEPFQRIHADFAGPFMGVCFLIIVDAFSKWPEVKVISDMTTETTIDRLREFFATFGLPSVLVTDRGTQFMSDGFQSFLKKNGIVHKTGAPYHPATNGKAERYVQTFKDKIKALRCSKSEIQKELCKILMAYGRTVHPTTGKSPSMLVFGRQMRSRIDLMIPSLEKGYASLGEEKAVRSFEINDRVAARDFLSNSEKWRFGTVSEKMGKLHYMVEFDDGRIWKRHIDQLPPGPVYRPTYEDAFPRMGIRNKALSITPSSLTSTSVSSSSPNPTSSSQSEPLTSNEQHSSFKSCFTHSTSIPIPSTPVSDTHGTESETGSNRTTEPGYENRRRSNRIRRPPIKLDL